MPSDRAAGAVEHRHRIVGRTAVPALACLVLAAGCGAARKAGVVSANASTRTPIVSSSSTTDPDGQSSSRPAPRSALCDRLGGDFLGGNVRREIVVSSALVPAPLVDTGFGPPDAHCATDPGELGLFYEALVWFRPVDLHYIKAFEQRLRVSGFRVKQGIGEPYTYTYTAPAGITAQIGGRLDLLHEVFVSAPTDHDPATSIVWI